MRRSRFGFLAVVLLSAFFSAGHFSYASDAREGKSGIVTGVVTAKGEDWIEVKADKARKAERYVPFFTVGMIQDGQGGTPQLGGKYDAGVVEQIRQITPGARVEVSWRFEQEMRIVSINILDKAGKEAVKKAQQEKKYK
jgi:hypothetical protein